MSKNESNLKMKKYLAESELAYSEVNEAEADLALKRANVRKIRAKIILESPDDKEILELFKGVERW